MLKYLRSAEDRKNAILNDAPDTKFYFESQKVSDIPDYQSRYVQNYIDVDPFGIPTYVLAQRNDWGAQEVRRYGGLIDAAAARYAIDPDIVKAIIYTEVSRGGLYGYPAERVDAATHAIFPKGWFEAARTILPGNIDTSWQKLIPGSDVHDPKDNIELTTKLIAQIAKRLDDPSIENIYSLYNSLSHDRTYVNAETKTTPYFAKMAMEAKAWEKDNWSAPEFPKDTPPDAPSLDRQGSFGDRFGNWGSSPAGNASLLAPDRSNSFNKRFGNWGSTPAGEPGSPRSPVLRALQNYKKSEAPNGPASTSAQGVPPASPALQPDIAGAGGVLGKFIGDSLITPAEAASPSGPMLRGPAAPNLPREKSALRDRSQNAPDGRRPATYPRLQSRRVSSAFPGITPLNPNPPAPPPERGPLLGIFSGKPMSPSPFPLPLGGLRENSDASVDGNWFTRLGGIASGNASQPASAPPTAGSKPVRSLGRRIVDRSQASAFDTSAPAVPFVPSNASLAPDRQDSFGNGNGVASAADGSGDTPSSPTLPPQPSGGSMASTLMSYIRYLNELDRQNSQAPDTSAPAASFVPPDDQNLSGGVLGRAAALAGFDPQNPTPPAPPPLDDQLRGFYRDDAMQPWFVQRQRLPLRKTI